MAHMYCSTGNENQPPLTEPPDPLTNIIGTTQQSKHFLQYIRKYNAYFQMTSFGATAPELCSETPH